MTIQQALNALQEPYKTQALSNMQTAAWPGSYRTHLDDYTESISNAVLEAFNVDESEEGRQYWMNYVATLKKLGL